MDEILSAARYALKVLSADDVETFNDGEDRDWWQSVDEASNRLAEALSAWERG